ncbi:hypothetical protein ABIE33_006237, partial [Ensifer sp. 4252]
MAKSDQSLPVPEAAFGLWQRESIRFDDGSIDTTTRVFWAQTASHYIDIRIPAHRVDVADADLGSLSVAELASLGEQKGFAGTTVSEGNRFSWHRSIDFRPGNGRPDTGIVKIEGDMLYEEGDPSGVLGVGYRETYRRRAHANDRRVALELMETTGEPIYVRPKTPTLLILLGDYFLFARGRSGQLPQAETLTELLVPSLNDAATLAKLLDCEISFGRIQSNKGFWIVELSTHPWRERHPLFELKGAEMAGGSLYLNHRKGRTKWSVTDSNIELGCLARIFFSEHAADRLPGNPNPVIRPLTDQNPFAQALRPIDMMRQGWFSSFRQA